MDVGDWDGKIKLVGEEKRGEGVNGETQVKITAFGSAYLIE